MAITPRMPDTAHRTLLRGYGARTPRFDLHMTSSATKREKPRFLLLRGRRDHRNIRMRHVLASRGKFVKAVSDGLQASCRPYGRGHHGHSILCAARRCACEEENEIPRRHDDAVARRPQHRAGADLLVRHVSLRRIRRAGRSLLSLSSRTRVLNSGFAIAGAIRPGSSRRRGNNSHDAAVRSRSHCREDPIMTTMGEERRMRPPSAPASRFAINICLVSSSFARGDAKADQTGSSR